MYGLKEFKSNTSYFYFLNIMYGWLKEKKIKEKDKEMDIQIFFGGLEVGGWDWDTFY